MSHDDDRHPSKDAEKPDHGQKDRFGEDDKEGLPLDDTTKGGPSLIDTVSDVDPAAEPAHEIEENGEPFEGNHA